MEQKNNNKKKRISSVQKTKTIGFQSHKVAWSPLSLQHDSVADGQRDFDKESLRAKGGG